MSEVSQYSPICCDANIVIRLVTDSPDGPVNALWQGWQQESRLLFAPMLLRYEVTNGLYRLGMASNLSFGLVESLIGAALALPITFVTDRGLHFQAAEFANRFKRPATYDAHYLAAAYLLSAELWTADKRLFNAVSHELTWVHLLDL